MGFTEIILLFFSFQALLLGAFFMIKNRGYTYANRLFALFLFLFSFSIFSIVLFWSRFNEPLFIQLIYTFYIPFSLYGAIFYFYVKNLVTGAKISIMDAYHFLPFIMVLWVFGEYMVLPLEEKILAFRLHRLSDYKDFVPYFDYCLTAFIIVYGFVIYNKYIKTFDKEDVNLRIWLKLTNSVFLLFALSFVVYITLLYFGLLTEELDYFITYMMVLFVGIVSYFCVIQPEVFNGRPIDKAIPFVKYETSGLSPSFAKELKGQLTELMESDRPFLNPELKLNDLAELLDISRHHASQLINEQFNMSFYEFINMYRIGEAKIRLKEDRNDSIESISHECGFNNRVSFYKSFKKMEGITPSDYRNHFLAS